MILARFSVGTSLAVDMTISTLELGQRVRDMGLTALFGQRPSKEVLKAFTGKKVTQSIDHDVMDQIENRSNANALAALRNRKSRAKNTRSIDTRIDARIDMHNEPGDNLSPPIPETCAERAKNVDKLRINYLNSQGEIEKIVQKSVEKALKNGFSRGAASSSSSLCIKSIKNIKNINTNTKNKEIKKRKKVQAIPKLPDGLIIDIHNPESITTDIIENHTEALYRQISHQYCRPDTKFRPETYEAFAKTLKAYSIQGLFKAMISYKAETEKPGFEHKFMLGELKFYSQQCPKYLGKTKAKKIDEAAQQQVYFAQKVGQDLTLDQAKSQINESITRQETQKQREALWIENEMARDKARSEQEKLDFEEEQKEIERMAA